MRRLSLSAALALLAIGCEQPAQPPSPEQCVEPAGPRDVRLLTRAEYDRAVRDLLGDTTAPASTSFPAENVLIGYENDGDNHRASPLLVESWLRTSERLAQSALAERAELVLPCAPGGGLDDRACLEALVDTFGRRAFRRPLSVDERAVFVTLIDDNLARFGRDTTAALVVEAALNAPQFLYRVDVGDGARATGYEMASRLSFFLWGSIPDEALLAAAEAGDLDTAAGLEREVRRMLADERAKDTITSFVRQWLGLDRLDGITKDAAALPEFDPRMRQSWRASVNAFVASVVWGGSGSVRELLSSEQLYVDELLAPLYGVAGPDHDGELVARTAPRTNDGAHTRAGLLTQPALMALLAGTEASSPIRRGVFLREKLLCTPISPPPPDLNVSIPPPDPTLTTRERFERHTSEESCRGCHQLIDPVGFGFERYDALGRYRDIENGLPVDDSGELRFTADASIEGTFAGAVDLGDKLAGSSQLRDCMVGQLFTFAMGRVPDSNVLDDDDDDCTLDALRARYDATDGNVVELLVAIATSDAFRTVRGGGR